MRVSYDTLHGPFVNSFDLDKIFSRDAMIAVIHTGSLTIIVLAVNIAGTEITRSVPRKPPNFPPTIHSLFSIEGPQHHA